MTNSTPPDAKTDERISRFADCAYEQLISSEKEDGKPFDNTLNLTADMHMQLRSELKPVEFYKDYLCFKFMALWNIENGRTFDEIFADEFGPSKSLLSSSNAIRLKQMLSSFMPSERNAYLARLSQLPKSVVIEKYYFVDDSFTKWSQAIEQKYLWYGDAFNEQRKEEAERKLLELYDNENINFVDEVNLEYYERTRISIIAEMQRSVFVQLRQRQLVATEIVDLELPSSPERHILHLDKESQATVREIISQIASAIWASEEIPTLYDFMQVVVDRIVAHYDCRFADFLLFDPKEETLWFTISSLNPAAEDVEVAGPQLHYRVGQGISGSVCYLEPQADARWVGTNDLSHDPRASLYHLSDSSGSSVTLLPGPDGEHAKTHRLYGIVYDYWLFPLFSLDRPAYLRGAVRVINKSRNSTTRGPAWSLLDKLEIAEIARTLELFLPLFPPDETTEADPDEGLTPKSAAAVIRKLWEAEWIDKTFCRKLVSHLMQVALRKVEDYSLGCNICVVKSDFVDNIIGILPPYPPAAGLTEGSDLRAHMDVYSFVHPIAATFVFTENGAFIGCRELRSRQHADSVALMKSLVSEFRSLTTDSSAIMFFVLNRGTKTIRIYGENDGDIYLREDTGYWVERGYQELLDRLAAISENNNNLKQHTIDLAFKRAWQLALERTGAILVVANSYPQAIADQTILSSQINLDECPPLTFSDLARRDGAVWINWSAMIERAGVIVGTVSGDRRPRNESKLGGARHAAARGISKDVPESLVFVISQNGGISAFFAGEELFYRA